MKANLILELEGKRYILKTHDINIFVRDNYVTIWTDSNNSFDIPIRGAEDEGK